MNTQFIFIALVLATTVFITNFILKQNLINKLFNLILIYITSALFMTILNNYFLGLTLIIVYVGAIMIFFLFVVMLLNTEESSEINTRNYIILTLFIISIILYFNNYQSGSFNFIEHSWYLINTSNIQAIGFALSQKYINLVLTIGTILLIIIVSIIKIFK